MIGNAKRTNETIESVLTLSRGSQPRAERILLGDWLAAFVHELTAPGAHTGANIAVSMDAADAAVSTDPTHLRQIMQNLCENGLRYSERATGAETLELIVRQNADAGTDLDVIDQGPGISEADASSIYEPFFTTESKGTGLGLYLARELCEANRIRLEYRGSTERGSCFRLIFP